MKTITGYVVQRGKMRTIFPTWEGAYRYWRVCLGSIIREIWREA